MSLLSTVGIAKLGTKSLRTTVPEGIVAYLDIEPGDKLEWKMEIMNGKKIVIMRKAMHKKEIAKVASKYIINKE